MSIVRDIALGVQALTDSIVVTCSTQQVILASTANQVQSSNAYLAGGGAGIAGRIIDRLNEPFITARYTVAMPFAYLESTRGSTEANRQLAIGIKLQHGNSSGGGDMADLSTGSIPSDNVLFTTAQSTVMASWSTGPIRAMSNQCYFDLRPANRYIRAVVSAFKNKATTESSGDESFHVGASMALLGGDVVLQNPWTSAGSSTTSSST